MMPWHPRAEDCFDPDTTASSTATAITALVAARQSPDVSASFKAIGALAEINTEAAVQALVEAVYDERDTVSQEAMLALQKRAPSQVIGAARAVFGRTSQITGACNLLLMNTGAQIGGVESLLVGMGPSLESLCGKCRLVFPERPDNTRFLEWARARWAKTEESDAVQDLDAGPRTRERSRALCHFVQECGPDTVNFHFGWNYVSFKDVLAARAAGSAVW